MPRPARVPRLRGALPYDKPALSHEDLVDRLSARGLEIPDRSRALRYLRHIGYFRLSPYTIPFQHAGQQHLFRQGVTFDHVLDLYVFDRALRLLVLDAVERVEVAVRAAPRRGRKTRSGRATWRSEHADSCSGTTPRLD